MDFTLDNIKDTGAFTGAPVPKEITWTCQGQEYTATVYVRRLSYITAVADIRALSGQVDGVAGRIAASICDKDGKPIFTPELITGDADPNQGPLDGGLTLALLEVIAEVNHLGKTPSRPTKKRSGTSSSSTASAAARSPKPSSG